MDRSVPAQNSSILHLLSVHEGCHGQPVQDCFYNESIAVRAWSSILVSSSRCGLPGCRYALQRISLPLASLHGYTWLLYQNGGLRRRRCKSSIGLRLPVQVPEYATLASGWRHNVRPYLAPETCTPASGAHLHASYRQYCKSLATTSRGWKVFCGVQARGRGSTLLLAEDTISRWRKVRLGSAQSLSRPQLDGYAPLYCVSLSPHLSCSVYCCFHLLELLMHQGYVWSSSSNSPGFLAPSKASQLLPKCKTLRCISMPAVDYGSYSGIHPGCCMLSSMLPANLDELSPAYKLFARPQTCRLSRKWFTVAAILSRSRCAWGDRY
jgi:hypothetical protein